MGLRWLLQRSETKSITRCIQQFGSGYVVSSSLSLPAQLQLGRLFQPCSVERVTEAYQEILKQCGVCVGDSCKWMWLPEHFEKDLHLLNTTNCPLKEKALLACCQWIKSPDLRA